MFALAVRANHLAGENAAIENALGFLTVLSIVPFGLPLIMMFGSDWGLAIFVGTAVASYALHRHLLVRRKKGLRMLARYDDFDPVDLIGLKVLATIAVIGWFSLSLSALAIVGDRTTGRSAVPIEHSGR